MPKCRSASRVLRACLTFSLRVDSRGPGRRPSRAWVRGPIGVGSPPGNALWTKSVVAGKRDLAGWHLWAPHGRMCSVRHGSPEPAADWRRGGGREPHARSSRTRNQNPDEERRRWHGNRPHCESDRRNGRIGRVEGDGWARRARRSPGARGEALGGGPCTTGAGCAGGRLPWCPCSGWSRESGLLSLPGI